MFRVYRIFNRICDRLPGFKDLLIGNLRVFREILAETSVLWTAGFFFLFCGLRHQRDVGRIQEDHGE